MDARLHSGGDSGAGRSGGWVYGEWEGVDWDGEGEFLFNFFSTLSFCASFCVAEWLVGCDRTMFANFLGFIGILPFT